MTVVWTLTRLLPVGALAGAALMALQSCGAPSARDSAPDTMASLPPECPALLASGTPVFPLDEDELRYFALSRYGRFPPADRALVQRADVENSRCRGGRGNVPETLRACNRRRCVTLELEARNWCWGGGDSGATDTWVRCSELPNEPPLNRELPYPESEIMRMYPPRARPLDVAFSNVEMQFYYEVGDALAPGNPVRRMREEAEASLAACGDSACRRQVEADHANRLAFALGDPSRPIAGIPLRAGFLTLNGGPVSGSVHLLPLGGNRLLAWIAPGPTDSIRLRCRGIVAGGQLGPDGIARLAIDSPGRAAIELRVLGPTRIALRPGGEAERDLLLCKEISPYGEYRAIRTALREPESP